MLTKLIKNHLNNDKKLQVVSQKSKFLKITLASSISMLCLILSGCGDDDTSSSSPVAVDSSTLPNIVQEDKQTQASIALLSMIPSVSATSSSDVRTVMINDTSNCPTKLSFFPPSIAIAVDENVGQFNILAPLGSGKCQHTITFSGNGISESKTINVVTDQTIVTATANMLKAALNDNIIITLKAPRNWEGITATQSYQIITNAPGVTFKNNTCHFIPSKAQTSCQIIAHIDNSAKAGNYVFNIEPIENTGVPITPKQLNFTINIINAYISNFGSDDVTYCSIINDGSLRNCIIAGSKSKNGFNDPESIVLDKNSGVYIINYSANKIDYCTITKTGSFHNCITAYEHFDGPSGLALNGNGGAYVNNYNSSSNNVYFCTIAENGSLNQCVIAEDSLTTSFDQPSDIILDDKNGAYISNFNSNKIDYCTIGNNGLFNHCIIAGDESQYGFDGPEGLSFDGNGGIYIANGDSSEIQYCTINEDGSFNHCIIAGNQNNFGFDGSVSIHLDHKNRAYIVNVDSNEISYCSIMMDGSFFNCIIAGDQSTSGFYHPYNITTTS